MVSRPAGRGRRRRRLPAGRLPPHGPAANALDKLLADLGTGLDIVLELVVENEEVIRRLSGRRTCRGCGKIWHVEFDAPVHEGVCDRCGGELFQRDDDKAETIAERLKVYARDTSPLVDYYGAQGNWWASTPPDRSRTYGPRDRRAALLRRLTRWRTQVEIELETPEEIGQMRRAGLVVADALAPHAGRRRTRRHHRRPRRDRRGDHPGRRRHPLLQGLPRLPGLDLLLRQRPGRARHPQPRQVLRAGDLISIDCGAELDGWHGDAAITVGVGDITNDLRRLVAVAEDAMWAGIAAAARGVRSGKGRLTDISSRSSPPSRKAGRYGIVDGYGGHGIGSAMHRDPFVEKLRPPRQGPRPPAGHGPRHRADDHEGQAEGRRARRRLDRGHRRRLRRRSRRTHDGHLPRRRLGPHRPRRRPRAAG